MKTRIVRIITQCFFALLFLYLMFKMTNPVKSLIPVDLFTKIDPLLSLSAVISGRSLYEGSLVAAIILIITLLLGRVFCGWICPMGASLDLADKLFYRRKRTHKLNDLRKIKYYILSGLLAASIFSVQATYLLDPFSIFTRSIIVGFFAPLQFFFKWMLNQGYIMAGSSSGFVKPLGIWIGDTLGQWSFVNGNQLYMRYSLVFLAIFIIIISLNSLSKRFWCRNLCPLGALLGLFARIPLFKRIVGTKCNDCARCIKDCKMNAITDNPKITDSAECVYCFDCADICPKKTISFGFTATRQKSKETNLDLSRRRLLQGASAGIAFAVMTKIDPSHKRAAQAVNTKISSGSLIRPPGSVNEELFINRCVRCGNCMKTCPTGGLQPSISEAGIEGFWTPVLVPRIGYCQELCKSCGDVCPTKAIESFEIKEKKHLYIGTANVDRNRCIAWNNNERCMVCAEYCSYSAIESDMNGSIARPIVDPAICVGCGQCESACPVQPVAAIRVYSIGDKRYLSREEQAKIRTTANQTDVPADDGSEGIYPGLPY